MIIAIDFDGTCVKHEYPKIGKSIGAEKVLKELTNKGHKLILWTMRSGNEEKEAELWFRDNNIPLWAIGYNPTQKKWTNSNKAYANLYIDDAALGCPLKYDLVNHPDGQYAGEPVPDGRPYVDWEKVRKILVKENIL